MLSLVHLIYMAGDKCMRQNACLQMDYDNLGIIVCSFNCGYNRHNLNQVYTIRVIFKNW